MSNPWDRNEGRFDKPSSAPPGKVATARPFPPSPPELGGSVADFIRGRVVRIITLDEIAIPGTLGAVPPPVKKYDTAPGRRLKRKDR